MRKRFSFGARGPRLRKKAVWINIPFGNVAFTETVGSQVLVLPEDWEAQFSGQANETAVLRAIVGDIGVLQTVVGTTGGNGFFGIYINDKDATVPPTFSVAGMADADWLHTGAFGTASTLVTQTSASLSHRPVAFRAKRRLKSRDAIYIAAQFGTDAASPAGTLYGLLRFLIARD